MSNKTNTNKTVEETTNEKRTVSVEFEIKTETNENDFIEFVNHCASIFFNPNVTLCEQKLAKCNRIDDKHFSIKKIEIPNASTLYVVTGFDTETGKDKTEIVTELEKAQKKYKSLISHYVAQNLI